MIIANQKNVMSRLIYIAAGSPLSICGYCRKVTGETTAIISVPFYEQVGTEYASIPETLSIRFKPVEQCTCVEEVLRGAKVDCT